MNIEWTHKGVAITDIRKVKKFYVISINDKKITTPLFVDHGIFDGRLKSYYLNDSESPMTAPVTFTREQVLNVRWNMVISKGFFMKYTNNTSYEKVYKDEDKFYISFLEIDGPLGMHISS